VSATIAAWSGSTAPPTPAAVVALHTADQEGEDLDAALVRLFPEAQLEACEANQSSVKSASEAGSGVSWPVLVDIYRDHKLCSGDVKAATWERMYRPRMGLLLDLLTGGGSEDADTLLRLTAEQWAERPGCRTCNRTIWDSRGCLLRISALTSAAPTSSGRSRRPLPTSTSWQ
jgi:hypothetical protein